MSLLTQKKRSQLLEKTNLLVLGYCNANVMTNIPSNIPMTIQYICGKFYEQKDFFVDRKEKPGYIVSNQGQTIMRNATLPPFKRIYGFNGIDCQYELSKLKAYQKFTASWQITIDKWPTTPLETFPITVSEINIGIMEKPDLKDWAGTIQHYGIDDAGLPVQGLPKGTEYKQYADHCNVNKCERKISADDVVKIELIVIKTNYYQGYVRFYKNELKIIEFQLINQYNINVVYRLYVALNSPLSQCSLIDFQCKISD